LKIRPSTEQDGWAKKKLVVGVGVIKVFRGKGGD